MDHNTQQQTFTNGAGAGTAPGTAGSSKAPLEAGFKPQQNMVVIPPKKEDLQPSYATVVGADPNPRGWYGSMSTFDLGLCLLRQWKD